MAALAVRHLSLAFAGSEVLRDVEFEVGAGELVALVGHNGSGKSTIVKVLAGFHAPDQRSIIAVRGSDVPLPMRPNDQLSLGIAIVHQDLALVRRASVWENIGLGCYSRRFGILDARAERSNARRLLLGLSCDASPDALVEDLDMPDQACVAIARALRRIEGHDSGSRPNVLILDEATNFFSHEAAVQLLQRVKASARSTGMGVLVISHRITELLGSCERMIVLRDGVVVANRESTEMHERDVVQLMIPGGGGVTPPVVRTGSIATTGAQRAKDRESSNASGLHLSGLRITHADEPLNLDVSAGEVVGLTGLRGTSWEAVVPIVGGDHPGYGGTIRVGDRSTDVRDVAPGRMIRMGVGYVPSEQVRAAAFEVSASENFWAPRLSQFVRLGALRLRLMVQLARVRMTELNVLPPEPTRAMGLFSGGNRQKLIVGRWIAPGTSVLALDEPTQGIDIAARTELIERIRESAAKGVAVIVASQDYRDLAAMCDRVLVFGRDTTTLSKPHLTAAAIAACF